MNRIERAFQAQKKINGRSVSVFSFSKTCKILNVSAPTLRKYLTSGFIAGKKIGATWFITGDAIQTALDPIGENRLNPSVLCETTIVDASP